MRRCRRACGSASSNVPTGRASPRWPAQTGVLVSASVTPAPFFAALSRDVAAAVAAIDELKALLTDRLGERDAPSLTPLRNALTEIEEFIARVRQEGPEMEPEDVGRV